MNSPAALRLHLEPVSHPELGEIVVDDPLFPVGRTEPPFSEQDGEAVTRLSRRHARIFQQDDRFWLTDLASRNGTSCNGTQLSRKPVALSDGDEISFADICYRVRVSAREPEAELTSAEPLRMILSPVDMPGCDPLVISGFPFLVSKSEGVFSQHREMFRDSLAYISRRHAHFYVVSEEIFVEDLNSTNGTFLNGVRLEEHARRLQSGDSLAFGNPERLFRVEIRLPVVMSTGTEDATETGITAVTEELHAAKAGIPVDSAGAESAESFPEPESPGSKAEPPMAEASAGASTGSTGQPAAVDVADAEVMAESAGSSEAELEHGTILVDRASPFLDIFYDKEAGADSETDQEAAREAERQPSSAQADSRTRRRLRKVSTFWTELKEALVEDSGKGRRNLTVLGVLALLIVAGSLLIWQRGGPEREIRGLMTAGDYRASTTLASRYLVERPDDEVMLKLASRSALLYLIPGWLKQISVRDFDGAEQLIDETRELTPGSSQTAALLDLVAWMTRLEAFVLSQQGDNALVIYRDEAVLKSLIGQWQQDATGHRLRLSTILQEVPEFKATHAQVISHLRLLQTYNTIYLKASEALVRDIDSYLAAAEFQSLRTRITSFQQKYPRVGGTDLLLADLEDYLGLHDKLEQRQLFELLSQWRRIRLRTPPFQQQAATHIASKLPPESITRRYIESDSAWRAGEVERAVAILTPLTDQSWGDVARARIDRYQRISRDYQALIGAKQQSDYQDRLLRFYSLLTADTDEYYRRALRDDIEQARGAVAGRADERFGEARKHWDKYRSAGGITGLLRLEETVSRGYRRRAEELSAAYRQLLLAGDSYRLLERELPGNWQPLKSDILTELKRQRSWLQDLDKVLPGKLVQQKLELLPQLQQGAQPEASAGAQGAG